MFKILHSNQFLVGFDLNVEPPLEDEHHFVDQGGIDLNMMPAESVVDEVDLTLEEDAARKFVLERCFLAVNCVYR